MFRTLLAVCAISMACTMQAVAADAGAVTLNDSTFRSSIAQGITLVDFYANWCGPCKQMSPSIDALANEMRGKVTIAKFNIDENKALASSYNVSSLPTLILFKNGVEVGRVSGYQDKESIRRFILIAQ